jgi:hypothetical protein
MAESSGILLLDAENNNESGLTITEEGSNAFSISTGSKAHGTYGFNYAFDVVQGSSVLLNIPIFEISETFTVPAQATLQIETLI